MRILRFVFSGVLFMLMVSTQAQTVISAELRPRTEYSHGAKQLANPDQDASLATSQRTRLNFGYGAEKFKLFVTLQDVRMWGDQPQLVKNHELSASIFEAWAEVFFMPELTLKAGRMQLVYDNHRMLGNVGWAQQARSHDLALLKYTGLINAHLGIAYNEDGNIANNIYSTPKNYKAMQFLWLNKTTDNLKASILLLNDGKPYAIAVDASNNVTEQGVRYNFTAGVYANYVLSDLIGLEGSFYSQTGTHVSGLDMSAYEFMVNAIIKPTDKVKVVAGYEMMSGNDYNDPNTVKAFNPLYGTNHKFNGFMDYFYVGGQHLNPEFSPLNVGLGDMYVKGTFNVGPTVMNLHYHYFSAAADIDGGDGKGLGSEIDLSCGYNLSKGVNFAIGYSQMFATDNMEIIKGGSRDETNNWAYLMLTVTPTLFDSDKK